MADKPMWIAFYSYPRSKGSETMIDAVIVRESKHEAFKQLHKEIDARDDISCWGIGFMTDASEPQWLDGGKLTAPSVGLETGEQDD